MVSVLAHLTSEVTCGRTTSEMQYYCQVQPEEKTKEKRQNPLNSNCYFCMRHAIQS